MPATQLTIQTLGDMNNGVAGIALNECFAQIYRDLQDRGHDGKERVAEIKVRFRKRLTSGEVEVEVEGAVKLPNYRTDPSVCKTVQVAGQPALFFQKASPDNPDQEEIPFDGDGKRI